MTCVDPCGCGAGGDVTRLLVMEMVHTAHDHTNRRHTLALSRTASQRHTHPHDVCVFSIHTYKL